MRMEVDQAKAWTEDAFRMCRTFEENVVEEAEVLEMTQLRRERRVREKAKVQRLAKV